MSVLKLKDELGVWQDIPAIVGEAAGFGEVTATVDTNVGTPTVVVTSSGEDTAKNFAFQFKNLGYDDSDLQDDFADLANDFDVLQGQFDTAVAAVTVDSEVADVRVGADGTTYTSAGAAVRGQVSDLKAEINGLAEDGLLYAPFQQILNKGFNVNTGATPYEANWDVSSLIPVKAGEIIHISNGRSTAYNGFYKSDETYITGSNFTIPESSDFAKEVPTNAAYMRITNGHAYFDFKVWRLADGLATKTDLKELEGYDIQLDYTGGVASFASSVSAQAGKAYTIINDNDLTVAVFVDGYSEHAITLNPYSTGTFTAQNDGRLKFYKTTGDDTTYIVHFESRIDRLENRVKELEGYDVTLDYTNGVSGFTSSVMAKAGETYAIVNNNNLTAGVYVSGYAGHAITLNPYSTGIFTAQNDGNLKFYKTVGADTTYTVHIKSSLYEAGALTTKEYHCTPDSGFYNALQEIANEDADIQKILYVHQGVYDLYDEIGGVDYANSITDYSNWYNDNVIVPPNTKIIGVGKAVLQMNIDVSALEPSSEASGSLSPINAVFGCDIENIEIEASGCRYCMHIEGSGNSSRNDKIFNLKNIIARFSGATHGFGSVIGLGLNKGCVLNVDECILETEKDWGIGGHLNNGAGIINVSNTAFRSVRESFSISNSINARESDSIFTFINCYMPTIHIGNTESTVFNNIQYNFVKTDTTMTKDANVGTVVHNDYGCTVIEDF